MLLGVIADDFTGATDIAGFLVESGMRTVQLNGVPQAGISVKADAVVISLKSRSCSANQAISDSLAALNWLQQHGCQQFYFKYCSTFDSTAQGNIGPVTDALLQALDEDFTFVCPALPVNGRTVFNGYLFVLGELLNESGMKNHPVTPMTDASLVRLMDAQSKGKTGLINYQVIEKGVDAIDARIVELKKQGYRYAVVDAFNAQHLLNLGMVAKSLKLVTGGSGLATGIANNWLAHLTDQSKAKSAGYPNKAKTVILSGSCSVMTNNQVIDYQTKAPHFAVEVEACLTDKNYSQQVCDWVLVNLNANWAPMVYATAKPEKLQQIQAQYGQEASSQAVEKFFSQLATLLKAQGVKNFIVAGGETSGTVTQSLKVTGFHIGPQIAPGVPWVKSLNGELSLALKSGNFGDAQFFTKAQEFFL